MHFLGSYLPQFIRYSCLCSLRYSVYNQISLPLHPFYYMVLKNQLGDNFLIHGLVYLSVITTNLPCVNPDRRWYNFSRKVTKFTKTISKTSSIPRSPIYHPFHGSFFYGPFSVSNTGIYAWSRFVGQNSSVCYKTNETFRILLSNLASTTL